MPQERDQDVRPEGVNRRLFLLTMAAGLAAFGAGEARAQPADDAVSFVRGIYTREIARHNSKGRIEDAEFLTLFTRETQRIWTAARDNKNPPPAPLGPLVNAFFGPGVPPGREARLIRVTMVGGGAQLLVVEVGIEIAGNPRQMQVHVKREGDGWKFDDIAYDPRESFVTYHRRRAGL